MDSRHGGPPVALVVYEVGPKVTGRESWWDHDARTCS